MGNSPLGPKRRVLPISSDAKSFPVSRSASKPAIRNRRCAIWNIVFSNILINRLGNAAAVVNGVMRVGNATECDAWRLEKIDKDIFTTMFQIAYRRLLLPEPEAPRVLQLFLMWRAEAAGAVPGRAFPRIESLVRRVQPWHTHETDETNSLSDVLHCSCA
jgi:hypothetical protein